MPVIFRDGYLIDTDKRYALPTVAPVVHLCACGTEMEVIAGAVVIPGLKLPEDQWGNPMPLAANFKSCPRCGHCE